LVLVLLQQLRVIGNYLEKSQQETSPRPNRQCPAKGTEDVHV
jgi:hypothetical protein